MRVLVPARQDKIPPKLTYQDLTNVSYLNSCKINQEKTVKNLKTKEKTKTSIPGGYKRIRRRQEEEREEKERGRYS